MRDQASRVHRMVFYELEENELFWNSLDVLEALGDPDVIGQIVAILTRWALKNPLGAPKNAEGIRLLKAPGARINGIAMALRLAYFLDEHPTPSGAAGTVMLLHVVRYDEQVELTETGAVPSGEHWH